LFSVFFFLSSLRIWLPGFLFGHPPSLPSFSFFFISSLFLLSFLLFLFFILLSWYGQHYYCNPANTKLHIVQGQKWCLVEIWEEEKGMETILPLKIK
jgi:hypothetical protein